jgi:hypothetical protein
VHLITRLLGLEIAEQTRKFPGALVGNYAEIAAFVSFELKRHVELGCGR